MKLIKKQLVTGLIIMTGATYAQATEQCASATTNTVPLVFSQTYVSAGADATFDGNIAATTYFVGGAVTSVTGSIQSGTAITLGADSNVVGNTESGTATTLGAATQVVLNTSASGGGGNVTYVTALTEGASSEFVQAHPLTAKSSMTYFASDVESRRCILNELTSGSFNDNLNARMDVNTTLDPTSGDTIANYVMLSSVQYGYAYTLSSLTTGAGIKLELNAAKHYLFNIDDMLSLGAETEIVQCDSWDSTTGECVVATSPTTGSVTWNVGGYASVGEKAVLIGNVLAKGYISTGVDSVMKGNLHSQTSYVTIGASGTVNP